MPSARRPLPFAAAGSAATKAASAVAERASVSPSILLVATVLFGAGDFILAIRRIPSLALGAALTLLVVPWAVLVLRSDKNEERASRRGFHVANIALVLAFLAAKWLVFVRAATEGAESYVGSYRSYTAALTLLLLLGTLLRGGRVARLVAASADHPARLMAATFGLASIVGALLLSLPISLRRVTDVSLVDSWFVSTSAVCVTGLSTVNVVETYTLTGQAILLLLIQIGGLGIMVLAAAVTMLAGQRLGVKNTAVLAEMVDARSLHDLKKTIRSIVTYTLVFEAIGAAILYVQLEPMVEVGRTANAPGSMAGAGSALWAAVFHSVSAFCNAGFSNFRDGAVPLVGEYGIAQTLAALVFLGGLGFPVIHELMFRVVEWARGKRPNRVTLNTRISLATTGLLLLTVTIAYLVLENGASFANLSTGEKLNAASFQSVAARTAGFNVVDLSQLRPASVLLTCVAMFVGADPGSCGGGIKTTTFGVLFAAYRGELRGQRPRLFDRTIPEAVVRRAMGVAFLSTTLVVGVVFVLLLTETHPALDLLFEAVSAFSTTGLSTGITPKLSIPGKLVLTLTMLIGRVGPLTMALALSNRGRQPQYELPEERVMIG